MSVNVKIANIIIISVDVNQKDAKKNIVIHIIAKVAVVIVVIVVIVLIVTNLLK
jgi:hypothetical protein